MTFEQMKQSHSRNTITIAELQKQIREYHESAIAAHNAGDITSRRHWHNCLDKALDEKEHVERCDAQIVSVYARAIHDMLDDLLVHPRCIVVTKCAEFGWTGQDYAMIDAIMRDGTVMAHNCHGERYILRMGDHFAPYRG